MLDLVPTNSAIRPSGDGWEYRHNDIADLSLYEEHGRVSKVPIDALTSYPDRTVNGEVIRDIITPTRLKGFSALVNDVTGDLLQTRPVGDSYNLVPHHKLFDAQAEKLSQGDLPIEDVTVTDRLLDHGLRAHRTIHFNSLSATIEGMADRVVCRMDVFNSVDMSWSFQIFSGAYRDLCRNTLVFGGAKAYHQKRKHTKNLSVGALISKAAMGLEFWQNNRDQMELWRGRAMNSQQFAALLAETICRKRDAAADAGQGDGINRRLMNYLLHRFEEEERELGRSMWAGYNALTHWSTHTDTEWTDTDGKTWQTGKKTARPHMVARQRADAVRTVIESDRWRDMEGLAIA